jgi:hypothetical protein
VSSRQLHPGVEDRVAGKLFDVGFLSDGPIAFVAVAGQPPVFLSAAHGKRVDRLTLAEVASLPGGDMGRDAVIQATEAQLQGVRAIAEPVVGSVMTVERYDFPHGIVLQGGYTPHPSQPDRDYWVRLATTDGQLENRPGNEPPGYFPQALAYNAARSLAAYGDLLGKIVVWDLKTATTRLTKQGRGVYTAAFTRDGKSIVFGYTPDLEPGHWAANRYGKPEWTFDLETLQLHRGATAEVLPVRTDQGPAHLGRGGPLRDPAVPEQLRASMSDSLPYWRDDRPGPAAIYPRLVGDGWIWSYSFLRTDRMGISDPIVAGTQLGDLFCLDPQSWIERRAFLGHRSAVTSVGESPNGRRLVSGSLDGTVKIWSLEKPERSAFPDFAFDFYTSAVTFIPPGGPSSRLDIRPGDLWKTMDGRPWREVTDEILNKTWRYRVGQVVPTVFRRGDTHHQINLPLVAYGDVVEPLVSLYVDPEGEWVAWTPEGF